MAVINRIAGFAEDLTAWRRHLHENPELGFACHDTARFVEEKLRAFGVDHIETGIAESGIVAIIEGRQDGPTIGLRADMDALPIQETTGAPHASRIEGTMHACGHDGHTTMLLGAARYLAETRAFRGRVALVFQPAEEGPGGGRVMVEEGILERYNIEKIYALHTLPNEPEGHFLTTSGPIMAAVDTFHIDLSGQGGHAAFPHETRDPVIAACGIVQAIQSIASRNHDARDDLVISVTQIHTGTAENIVPDMAYINGTIRVFDRDVRDMVHRRLPEIVAGQAASYAVNATCRIDTGYPATVNHAVETDFAAGVARDVSGAHAVTTDLKREMGAEDFSYMLEKTPGAFLFLGQGAGPVLHHSAFDFNDAVAPVGASFFARLVEQAQPLEPQDKEVQNGS
ncbi:MAG: M20 aminoacylase family protein [Pseudomonadota bacterium]